MFLSFVLYADDDLLIIETRPICSVFFNLSQLLYNGRTLCERSRLGETGLRSTRGRVQRAPETVDFSTPEHAECNEPFTTAELENAINSLRSVSEGPDAIHNDMLRNLPAVPQEALLAVVNSLWESGVIPEA